MTPARNVAAAVQREAAVRGLHVDDADGVWTVHNTARGVADSWKATCTTITRAVTAVAERHGLIVHARRHGVEHLVLTLGAAP